MAKFQGTTDHQHGQPPSMGVLLTNLGTPDAPTPAALRRYLGEFLFDPRVIEVPRPIWWLILHGIILRTRPRRSAEAYKKIWTAGGAPLLDFSIKQQNAIQEEINQRFPGPIQVELGMRYGNPSIASAMDRLRAGNAKRILILPLYPQYSATTTASTFDAIAKVLNGWRWLPELRMVNHYHDDPGYIEALVCSIRNHWAEQGKPDKLLFSFHGLPKHYFLAGDPYFCECQKTARLVAEQLELDNDSWHVTFQSRFGPREWLKPYTDMTLKEWGAAGVEKVDLICPGFSADCLETLEEIKLQNRKFFLEAGGKQFSYIPALNDQPAHIAALVDLIAKHSEGWQETALEWNKETHKVQLKATAERAERLRGKYYD